MKGRSHRLPAAPAAPMDDWLDGSWTVDCPCGVTFDDGEEMVKCDECGVWVHTRCTRFVKDQASFTCDKCKARKQPLPVPTFVPANIEENEVAQLLAELPTKADPCPPPPPPAYHRPTFRRWAERPMEEKVHVQGVPGGDPALFAGLSTIFSQELWRCTGYVPKKFNFRYREFPCWEEDESDNPASAGADLLFSLSKEAAAGAGMVERLPSPEGWKSRDGEGLFSSGGARSFTRKERSKFRGASVHSGKRREEDPVRSKNRIVKKIRISTAAEKNKGFASRFNGSNPGLAEKEIARDLDKEMEKMKREDKRADKSSTTKTEDLISEEKQVTDERKNSLSVKSPSMASAPFRCKPSMEAHVQEEKVKVEVSACNGNLSKSDEPAKSYGAEQLATESIKKLEVASTDGLSQPDDNYGGLMHLNHGSLNIEVEAIQSEHAIEHSAITSHILSSSRILGSANSSSDRASKTKNKEDIVSDIGQVSVNPTMPSPLVTGVEAKKVLLDNLPEGVLVPVDLESNKIPVGLIDDATQVKAGESEHVRHSGFSNSKKLGSELESTVRLKRALEQQNAQDSTGEHTKLESSSPDNTTGHKLAVVIGKSASEDMPRLSNSDSYKSPGTTSSSSAARTVPFTKRVKVSSSNITKKEIPKNIVSFEGKMHVQTSRQSKDLECSEDRSSEANKTISQSSEANKTGHVQASKHKLVDTKGGTSWPSKASPTNSPATSSVSGRFGGPSLTQSTLVQSVVAPTDSGTKNIRISSNCQPSSRADNHSTVLPPPSAIPPSIVNTTTTLSDEELAKRLHHELNSSPRVSRVPRGLHAGGTQFTSSTSASILSKRSSSASSGGKLQVLVSRKKNKEDTGKDAPQSREVADKVEKFEDSSSYKKQSEPSHRNHSIKKDARKGSLGNLSSVKESNLLPSHAVDGSGPTFRTLPGLIDDIMNKGHHMTYEELCDAVLPHWHSLRKPNGEQYTYSSHSLAVLDCLRNRDEWAHLVDYEPKTYTSKKRNKSSMSPTAGVSDNVEAESKVSVRREDRNGESCLDNLPTKGKRLARKRRKLMLQGRAVQATRVRVIGDEASDDDLVSFSDDEGSQSFSSKDEIQGSRRSKNTSGLVGSSEEESD